MAAATGSDNMDKNPMTTELVEVFQISASTRHDRSHCYVSCMDVSSDNRLYLVDSVNNKLKVTPLTPPLAITTFSLDLNPNQLAVLPNGNIVMTTMRKFLLFVIDGKQKKVATTRRYMEILVGPGETLIASCHTDMAQHGRVDMFRFDGKFVRTVVQEINPLISHNPLSLCVVGSHLLMGDRNHNAIHRVDINNGQIVDTITHSELSTCVEAHQDENGFLYVLFYNKSYAMIRSPQGEWRYILNVVQYRKEGDYTTAMHLSKSGMLIVAWMNDVDLRCIVKGYRCED